MITSRDLADFTHGACYLLAEAVTNVTGWPAAAFWDGFRPAGHVFNAMPDGRYLDINGAHTRAEMMTSRWGHARGRHGITRHTGPPEDWRCGLDENAMRERAQKIVPELLAALNIPASQNI